MGGSGAIVTDIGASLVDVPALIRRLLEISEGTPQQPELEQRLGELEVSFRHLNLELETSKSNWEALSYSISHDLRAPLRAIDGFSRILLEEDAKGLSTTSLRYLSFIHDGSQEMGRLLESLLAFSRLAQSPLAKSETSPASIVGSVLEELGPECLGRKIDFTIEELPTCFADEMMLKRTYYNLLSNALKFTRRKAIARIEVGSLRHGNETVYFVRDNGIGFDMRNAKNLFGLFQRLHAKEEYEGAGVGLAMVAQIVRRHGGRVWAEAGVNEGASFYFTLEEADQ